MVLLFVGSVSEGLKRKETQASIGIGERKGARTDPGYEEMMGMKRDDEE